MPVAVTSVEIFRSINSLSRLGNPWSCYLTVIVHRYCVKYIFQYERLARVIFLPKRCEFNWKLADVSSSNVTERSRDWFIFSYFNHLVKSTSERQEQVKEKYVSRRSDRKSHNLLTLVRISEKFRNRKKREEEIFNACINRKIRRN